MSMPVHTCLLAFALAGCSGAQERAEAAKVEATCAAIRDLYDTAQSRMIDSGVCDHTNVIEACVPHVALREALVLSLEKAKCPTH